jgi:hypothetical protein
MSLLTHLFSLYTGQKTLRILFTSAIYPATLAQSEKETSLHRLPRFVDRAIVRRESDNSSQNWLDDITKNERMDVYEPEQARTPDEATQSYSALVSALSG